MSKRVRGPPGCQTGICPLRIRRRTVLTDSENRWLNSSMVRYLGSGGWLVDDFICLWLRTWTTHFPCASQDRGTGHKKEVQAQKSACTSFGIVEARLDHQL